jgi:hypothetical protein
LKNSLDAALKNSRFQIFPVARQDEHQPPPLGPAAAALQNRRAGHFARSGVPVVKQPVSGDGQRDVPGGLSPGFHSEIALKLQLSGPDGVAEAAGRPFELSGGEGGAQNGVEGLLDSVIFKSRSFDHDVLFANTHVFKKIEPGPVFVESDVPRGNDDFPAAGAAEIDDFDVSLQVLKTVLSCIDAVGPGSEGLPAAAEFGMAGADFPLQASAFGRKGNFPGSRISGSGRHQAENDCRKQDQESGDGGTPDVFHSRISSIVKVVLVSPRYSETATE